MTIPATAPDGSDATIILNKDSAPDIFVRLFQMTTPSFNEVAVWYRLAMDLNYKRHPHHVADDGTPAAVAETGGA
ncbi:hypothetical protein FJZ36_15205 [Candidatus Poribacteria bacterium]|nr:hypothetical protein [Candidatus Poribacteria bacterium]